MRAVSQDDNPRFLAALLILCLVGSPVTLKSVYKSVYIGEPQVMAAVPPPAKSLREGREGSAPYDTGGKIPGHPNQGLEDLAQVYGIIKTYRLRHEGKYPSDTAEIIRELARNALQYGFQNLSGADPVFTNPDTRYADAYSKTPPEQANQIWIYQVIGKRFDGTPQGGPKPLGTRDVLAQTHIYFHRNIRNLEDQASTINPVGFYLVLWDDGQVDKIPYDQLLYAPDARGGYVHTFPGQAGVGPDILTHDEYYTRLVGLTTSIRGKPVAVGQSQPTVDNGGPESLISLSRLLAKPLERERMWEILKPSQAEFSLADLRSDAAKLGLSLHRKKLTLAELTTQGGAAILYLSDANQIVTLATLDDQLAIVYDRGMARIVSREVLTKRSSGEALLPAETANATSRVRVDDALRILDFKSKDEEVTQKVILTNRGQEPLLLEIERPIPGCTQADLSSAVVPASQSATLTLKLKWRTMLPSDTQNIFVTLRTNDPVSPRVQLGFQLKLQAGKLPTEKEPQ